MQQKTDGAATAEVNGCTVGECIEGLVRQYPSLRGEILDSRGIVLLKWMVYINNRGLGSSDELSYPVKQGDTITLFPMISGG